MTFCKVHIEVRSSKPVFVLSAAEWVVVAALSRKAFKGFSGHGVLSGGFAAGLWFCDL